MSNYIRNKIIFVVLLVFLIGIISYSFSIYQCDSLVPSALFMSGEPLAIIMYHSITTDPNALNNWATTPQQLENDLIYIQNKGYTPILLSDLIDYAYHDKPLPDKPILLSFDDGYLDNYTNAMPILQKYHMKAELAIVGSYIDLYSKPGLNERIKYAKNAFLSWDKVKVMSDSGVFEVINHTYNRHSDGDQADLTTKTEDVIETQIEEEKDDIKYMQDLIASKVGKAIDAFSYPHGNNNQYSNEMLAELGFKAVFTDTEGGVNAISMNQKNALLHLKRINRPNGINSDEFFKGIDAVYDNPVRRNLVVRLIEKIKRICNHIFH